IMQTIKNSAKFGIKVGKPKIDFASITKRASHEVDSDAVNIEASIKKAKNITLFKGTARFIGQKKLLIKLADGEREIEADKIVIAAGTRPAIPQVTGLDTLKYMTSDEALRVEKLPKHLILIGGGYIAVELAHFFGSLGSKITILQRNVRLLPDEDEEIGNKFTELFSKEYDVRLKFAVKRVEIKKTKNGKSNERKIVVYGFQGFGHLVISQENIYSNIQRIWKQNT
ncbi:FAD-dependent oxidoreductase, partial [Candidatus Micrarchaeota archaeon]|nr:FAD-dependent oxidoreductase [Candidatus Micrarchaeota archaeon]